MQKDCKETGVKNVGGKMGDQSESTANRLLWQWSRVGFDLPQKEVPALAMSMQLQLQLQAQYDLCVKITKNCRGTGVVVYKKCEIK